MASGKPTPLEVRVTVSRLLELAYSRNEGLTTSLVREAGNLRLSVDQRGNAILTGSAGRLAFSAEDALKEIGLKAGIIQVTMAVDSSGQIQFNASVRVGLASVGASGTIDVEKFLMACSGILCHAARMLGNRSAELDRQFKEAMGH